MKYAIGFLGGAVFSAASVVLAGGRSAIMLWLGFALATGALAGILYLMGIRRTARFLSAFADAWGSKDAESKKTVPAPRQMPDRSGYVKPSKKRQLEILNDTIDEYRNRTPETEAFLSDPDLFGNGTEKTKVA